LLVDPDAELPRVEVWEDWILLPADERDLSIRVRGLARRMSRPEIVDDCILRNGYGAVMLPPAECSVARALIESSEAVVPRESLAAEVWQDGPPSARALDDLVYRVRRRVRPLHLDVFGTRGRGFVLGMLHDARATTTHSIGRQP
jgi:DNA-binding response OmpR family regulator